MKSRIWTLLLLTLLIFSTMLGTLSMIKADGQAGTTLIAEVTATAYWTRTFKWTIDKSVTPDSWEFYPGDSGTSTYTITVTKDSGTDKAWIEGIVSVINGGGVATENLAIEIELRNGVPPPKDLIATATVDVSGNPVLDPGETGYYDYSVDIPSADIHAGGLYKVTAVVTITNHSGYLGEPFGPSPSATTNLPSDPTLINDVIHVDDTNGGSWEFSDDGSVTYDKTFVYCEEGEHKNTATIRETGQSDDATVTVTCLVPPEATISGVKYDDSNANGARDLGEEGLKDWTIQLWKLDDDWDLVEEVLTGDAGDYIFTVTEAGHYKIVEVLQDGWMQTAPDGGYYEFDVELGEVYSDKDFGNIELGSISGHKFYDANVNGLWDTAEVPIEGWKVHLTGTNIRGDTIDAYAFTAADGKFIFENLLPGSYTVTEVFPPAWVPTTDTSFSHDLEEGEDYVGPDFGNVCLKPGYGGLTLGFWTNKNGQKLITEADVTALNGLNLYKPAEWTYPPFSPTLSTARTQIKNYLLSATAVDMRWMLSAQLIATKLDVLHGYLSASTIVYVGPSTYVPSGFISIDDIISNANAALLKPHPEFRSEQEYWKNLLDGLNNNRLPFVCPTPCPIVYP